MSIYTKIDIEEEVDWMTKIFSYVDGALSFVVATIVIVAASQGVPIYLIPIAFLIIAFFMNLVWN